MEPKNPNFDTHNIDLSTRIFRYMNLEHLLCFLESKIMRFNQRGSFSDYFEKNLNWKNQFALQAVGENVPVELNRYLKAKAVNIHNKNIEHTKFRSLPTSCWTVQHLEDALMWNSYTSGIGVRIESTVGKFMESIKPSDINCEFASDYCIYAPITYRLDSAYLSAEDNLFTKHYAYKNEEEFRFYFCNFADDNSIVPPNALHKFEGKGYMEIPANPDILIKAVTLSPNLPILAAEKIARWLIDEYKLTANQSSIRIS